jgi:hypothetical protein
LGNWLVAAYSRALWARDCANVPAFDFLGQCVVLPLFFSLFSMLNSSLDHQLPHRHCLVGSSQPSHDYLPPDIGLDTGSGHTASLSKKLRDHGRRRSISWSAIPSTGLHVALPNSLSGLSRFVGIFPLVLPFLLCSYCSSKVERFGSLFVPLHIILVPDLLFGTLSFLPSLLPTSHHYAHS